MITGIGIISPLGIGSSANWESMTHGVSGIRQASFAGNDSFPHSNCGVVRNFNPQDYIENRKLLKLMNAESKIAVAAGRLALEDAACNGNYSPERMGLYLGTGLTSGELQELIPLIENSLDEHGNFSYSLLGTKALPNCNPLLSFKLLTNMPLCYVSIIFNIKGPNMIFCPWSGKTAEAVGEGMRAIQHDEIDCALVGGGDSKSNYIGFLSFSKLGLLSQLGACCPFDKRSDGIILSEGATMLVLEDLEHAQKRSAHIYAELAGYGIATEPCSASLFSTNPHILLKAMTNALVDAHVSANEIDSLCASANSHPVGDRTEAQAIESCFHETTVSVFAPKALTGDMVAAASPFTIAVTALALQKGVIPPMINLDDKKEHIVFTKPHQREVRIAIANSFEMGNSKVSFVLKKCL